MTFGLVKESVGLFSEEGFFRTFVVTSILHFIIIFTFFGHLMPSKDQNIGKKFWGAQAKIITKSKLSKLSNILFVPI